MSSLARPTLMTSWPCPSARDITCEIHTLDSTTANDTTTASITLSVQAAVGERGRSASHGSRRELVQPLRLVHRPPQASEAASPHAQATAGSAATLPHAQAAIGERRRFAHAHVAMGEYSSAAGGLGLTEKART